MFEDGDEPLYDRRHRGNLNDSPERVDDRRNKENNSRNDSRDRNYDRRDSRDGRRENDRQDEHRFRDRDEERQKRRRIEEDEPLVELYSIHKGKVISIQEYGVFVEMEGFKRHGLVHISHISKARINGKAEIEQIVEVGAPVYVKVIGVSDDKKVSLSMKYANQKNGKDLDLNEVDLTMNSHKKGHSAGDLKAIQLGAVLDTVCKRCGGKGHMASECYAKQGEVDKYALLESPEHSDEEPPAKFQKHHKGDHSGKDKHKGKHKDDHSGKDKHKDDHSGKDKHGKDKKEKKEKKEKKHKKEKKDKKQ